MLVNCNITEYVKFAEHSYLTCQGLVLSKIISVSDDHVLNRKLWYVDMTPFVIGKCVTPLDSAICNHLLCVKALNTQKYVEAYNYQSACVFDVIQMYGARQASWMLPVIYTVCLELRLAAQKADAVSNSQGAILDNASECLMACCRIFLDNAGTSLETSRKVGLLCPVNHLLRINFKTQQFNLCQWMIRVVEPSVDEQSCTLAQLVTFKFFVGRLAVLEANYVTADKNLTYAFNKCHPSSYKNKRMILSYLLPVKMLLGFMPFKSLTEQYDLPVFWELLNAVKDGNLKKFKTTVDDNRKYFEDPGHLRALVNLKVITYRNIFKKVYLSQGCNKIAISCFHAGLQMMSDEVVTASETQSLLAMLIHKGQMKAYMSYINEVVFFPDNPFPRLSTLYYQM